MQSAWFLAGQVLNIERCPICFLQNISGIGPVALEKKSFDFFTIYGHDGHVDVRIMTILTIWYNYQLYHNPHTQSLARLTL